MNELINPLNKVLLKKLNGFQVVKKSPAFHGTRRFITAHTSVRHMSLSWASPIQSKYPHPTLLEIHSNIIHPSTPRSPQWSPSLRFPHQDPIHTLSSPIRATCPAHLILLNCVWFYKLRTFTRKPNSHTITYLLTYSLTYLLTYSMVQSPSWESNWFAASQEIPRISRNPKVHYRTHKCPPPVPILSQLDPVHTPHIPLPVDPSYPLIYAWVSQVVSFPHVSPTKNPVYASPPIRATCPAHLILLDSVTGTMFGERYRSLSFTLCNIPIATNVWRSLQNPEICR